MTRTDAPATAGYDDALIRLLERSALESGCRLHRGTYCWVTGPSYETPAEIGMLRAMGGSAVGMSTLPEVLAARQANMRVVGFSLISNLASGLAGGSLSHADVTAVASQASNRFTTLLLTFLISMD